MVTVLPLLIVPLVLGLTFWFLVFRRELWGSLEGQRTGTSPPDEGLWKSLGTEFWVTVEERRALEVAGRVTGDEWGGERRVRSARVRWGGGDGERVRVWRTHSMPRVRRKESRWGLTRSTTSSRAPSAGRKTIVMHTLQMKGPHWHIYKYTAATPLFEDKWQIHCRLQQCIIVVPHEPIKSADSWKLPAIKRHQTLTH